MDGLTVQEALLTGVRRDSKGCYMILVLLYNDGTWEKIFRLDYPQDARHMNTVYFRGRTRDQAIARLEKLYYNDILKGKFLDED